MVIAQKDLLEVESYSRTYTLGQGVTATSQYFSEPFIRAEFHTLPLAGGTLPAAGTVGTLDINGLVDLDPNHVVVFDGKSGSQNISNIQINLINSKFKVVVYWTKYAGTKWQAHNR